MLVEQFSASPQVKAAVKQNAERLAVKIMREIGPTKAAIASVAQEFLRQGRNLAEVSAFIGNVHPRMDRLKDLVVEVYPAPEGEIRVLVDGRDRPFVSYADGLYRRLRIPLFVSDSGALVELRNAVLTRNGYDGRRVRPLGPSEFELRASERSFELFKLLEEAKLSGGLGLGGADPKALARKYSISKLPLTEELLRGANLLPAVSAEYLTRLTREAEGRARTVARRSWRRRPSWRRAQRVVPEPGEQGDGREVSPQAVAREVARRRCPSSAGGRGRRGVAEVKQIPLRLVSSASQARHQAEAGRALARGAHQGSLPSEDVPNGQLEPGRVVPRDDGEGLLRVHRGQAVLALKSLYEETGDERFAVFNAYVDSESSLLNLFLRVRSENEEGKGERVGLSVLEKILGLYKIRGSIPAERAGRRAEAGAGGGREARREADNEALRGGDGGSLRLSRSSTSSACVEIAEKSSTNPPHARPDYAIPPERVEKAVEEREAACVRSNGSGGCSPTTQQA